MDSAAPAFGGAAAYSEKAGAVGSRRVGVDGNRTRYQSGAYVSTRAEWTIRQVEWYRDNKIVFYYRLRQKPEAVFFAEAQGGQLQRNMRLLRLPAAARRPSGCVWLLFAAARQRPESAKRILNGKERRVFTMKKKMISLMITAALLTAFAGCGAETSASGSENSSGGENYTIGISQFAEHGSLDNCREGFLEGLKEEGLEEGKNLTVKVNNAASDMGTAAQIAQSFAADDMDLICAIATPAAQAAYNAAMDKGIPVIYTAVTNPEEAQLADSDGNPVGAVTGTSDQLPVEAQLKMIRELLPEAQTIGILYTTSEANSVYSISQYEKLAGDYGFTLETAGVTSTSEVSLAAADLLDKVDCLTNLTDNTVVSALPSILDAANKKNIPVFGSEIEQVKIGCLAAEGLDYINLGKETGKMAAKILKGEASAEEMNYELLTDSSLYINQAVADNLGITIPDSMTERAVEVFEEIEQ